MFGLILVIDINFQWPDIWYGFDYFCCLEAKVFISLFPIAPLHRSTFTAWVHYFTIDIDFHFSYYVPYKEELKFAIIMVMPLIFMILYLFVDRMKPDEW